MTFKIITAFICLLSGVVDEPTKPLLRDIYGTDHYFDEYKEERTRAIVYVMLDEHCPVVRQQIPKLRDLHRKYNEIKRDRAGHAVDFARNPGDLVQFVGVYSKPDQSAKEVAQHAQSNSIPFRVMRDTRHEFAKAFGVTRLSEVVVFDANWQVIYQGPVDDQSVQGSTKASATAKYLEEVLDSLVAGKPSPHKKVPPVGCQIDTENDREYPKVTYADVESIIRNRCAPCHRAGEVGPMPLTSYEEIHDYAAMVEEVILEERMPPWPANSSHTLRNSLALSKKEREMMLAWLRNKMPLGDLKETNVPVSAPSSMPVPAPKFRIGEPDLIFEMPIPLKIPATGVVDYTYVPLEINGGKGFPEDRWIEAIECKPGSSEVVHHIQVHEFRGKPLGGKIDPIQQLLHYGLSVENARLLGSYTPGNLEENARIYSNFTSGGASAAMKLRRGANLLLEMHYTPNGKETTDRSVVAIRFAKEPPQIPIETWFPFRKRPDMVIPANTENHSLQDRYHFGAQTNGKAILLHGVRAHLHSRGKSYRLELINADAMSERDVYDYTQHDRVRGEVILQVPVWDFNWQHFYRFEKPILIRPSQALLATAHWDNSKFNPRNPDPKVDIPWGQQTTQEMFNTLFNFEVLEPGDPRLGETAGEKP